jgi:hypothetical protein
VVRFDEKALKHRKAVEIFQEFLEVKGVVWREAVRIDFGTP